jgi:hypothetical protein
VPLEMQVGQPLQKDVKMGEKDVRKEGRSNEERKKK